MNEVREAEADAVGPLLVCGRSRSTFLRSSSGNGAWEWQEGGEVKRKAGTQTGTHC